MIRYLKFCMASMPVFHSKIILYEHFIALQEFKKLNTEIMLQLVELDIIETLKTENKKMRAGVVRYRKRF